MPPTAVDPWTAFLQWLQTIIVPDWGGLINLLPIFIIIGLTGPALTLLVVYWVYVRAGSRRGRAHYDDPQPVPAPLDEDGEPLYPANQPYCPTHAIIYPARARECTIDGGELMVRCPVDDTLRVSSQQLCRTCGTRYKLGASMASVVVRSHGKPPAGGAAVA